MKNVSRAEKTKSGHCQKQNRKTKPANQNSADHRADRRREIIHRFPRTPLQTGTSTI